MEVFGLHVWHLHHHNNAEIKLHVPTYLEATATGAVAAYVISVRLTITHLDSRVGIFALWKSGTTYTMMEYQEDCDLPPVQSAALVEFSFTLIHAPILATLSLRGLASRTIGKTAGKDRSTAVRVPTNECIRGPTATKSQNTSHQNPSACGRPPHHYTFSNPTRPPLRLRLPIPHRRSWTSCPKRRRALSMHPARPCRNKASVKRTSTRSRQEQQKRQAKRKTKKPT